MFCTAFSHAKPHETSTQRARQLYPDSKNNSFRNTYAVYNIIEWLQLVRYAEQLHDHTQPKCYKIIRNASGKCGMFYQNYSHMPWEGSVVILKEQLWFFN